MKMFRNRLLMAMIGFLVVGSAIVGLAVVRIVQLRSAVRLHATHQAQVYDYFELHTNLREFYSEFERIVEDVDGASKLDFDAYRRRTEELLLSVRAEIEREEIELGRLVPADRSEGDDETSERARLLSLASEIQSMLAGSEIAASLFRADRTTEGLRILKEALDENVENKLDAILEEAVARDKAEARAIEAAIVARLEAAADRSIAGFAAVAALLVATAAAVLLPFLRSMAFLQAQADKLALGGGVDPAPSGQCTEFAAVHDGLRRTAAAQERLREERDVCEAEFSQREDAMREIDQVRRDFLADVSHELRTPLTVLCGVAEVALRTHSNDPEELKETLARIVDESRHVTRIVNDLFFISRSQAGALDLRTDIVDLAAVSEGAAREAEALALQAGGRVEWRGLSESVEVEGDADRLRQLFTILIDNALKYGGRSPAVDVDLTLAVKTVVIAIRDHGPGVPEEDLPHVFERLYRGAATATAEPGGSGLGLPLAKSIVEGHGGVISLGNAEGGGAISRVSLPVFDADRLEVSTS